MDLTSLPTLAILATLAALVGTLLVVLYHTLRNSRQSEPHDGGDPRPPQGSRVVYVTLLAYSTYQLVRRAFSRARRRLAEALPGRDGFYRVPWFLILGQKSSGKTTLLADSHLQLPFGEPLDPEGGAGVDWWLFEQSIVVEVDGDYLLRLDGRSSDDNGWRVVLRQLRRLRPRRPVDGIVLEIPSTSLVDPGGRVEPVLSEVARRAGILDRKLQQVQETLGMRCPIYVVVTKCDLLGGFREVTATFTTEERHQMFGWSNPYPVQAVYAPRWVDEAFASVRSNLDRYQLRRFGAKADLHDAPSFFLFVANLDRMREPMQVYSNHIFSQNAFQDPVLLRGIYFTGGEINTSPPDDSRGKLQPPRKLDALYFVRDLLERKVFPEFSLGQPASQILRKRRQRIPLIWGATALLLAASIWGLPRMTRSIDLKVDSIRPVLEQIRSDLEANAALRRQRGAVSLGDRAVSARRLIYSSNQLQDLNLRTLAAPLSLLSSIDADVQESFARGYQELVFDVFDQALNRDLSELQSYTPPPLMVPATVNEGSPASTPEFIALQTYVERVRTLERRFRIYDLILRTQTRDNAQLVAYFNELARPLLYTELRPANAEALRFFANVFARVQPTGDAGPTAADKEGLRRRTRQLATALFDRVFTGNPLNVGVQQVVQDIQQLPQGASVPSDTSSYRSTSSSFDQLRSDLANPDLAWVADTTLTPSPAVRSLNQEISDVSYLGPDLARELSDEAQIRFGAMQQSLTQAQTDPTGPVLAQKDGRFTLALSEGSEVLDGAIKQLLGEPFMAPEPSASLQLPRGNQRQEWDEARLKEALALYPPYQAYLAKNLASFPASLRNSAQETARDTLRANLLDLLAQAQQLIEAPAAGNPLPVLEQNIQDRVSNLQVTSESLNQVLDLLLDLDLRRDYDVLAGLLQDQQIHIFQDLSRLLDGFNLYASRPTDFDWWNGSAPPSPEAFGATDAKGLAAYLDAQRQTATRLAQLYAEPTFEAFESRGATWAAIIAPASQRWTTLLDDLTAYDSKVAGNSLAELESFITGPMQAVVLSDCLEQIPAVLFRSGSGSGDFAAHQLSLRQSLRARCKTLTVDEAIPGYDEIATSFNSRLAGRFPFSVGTPGRFDVEADAEAIRSFYRTFDQYAALIESVPANHPAFRGREAAVRSFLDRMDKVRTFFAPYLEADDPTKPPTYGLQVQFRVQRQQERGGEEIARWALMVDQEVIQPVPETGSWTYLQPVDVLLDWAANSPHVPTAALPATAAVVLGRQVTFPYNGKWALLALLRQHTLPGGGPEPETLELEVKVTPDPGSKGLSTSNSRVYIRLTVLTPDLKTVLKVPSFPVRAPTLDESD